MSRITHLECTKCGQKLSADSPQTVCPKDGGVLYARYDLNAIKATFSREKLMGRACSMWRYAEVLPEAEPVSLGEGFTPMLPSREYPNVYIKDEGLNPTGSFKARGLSAAVTMARHYGLKKLAIPSAGNAAGALGRGGCRDRSAHLHAQRRPYGKPHRIRILRCARDTGGRSDQRLRSHGW